MDFEQCEILGNRYGRYLINLEFEFEARATGPDGVYIVARTPRFPPFEATVWTTVFPMASPQYNIWEPDERIPLQREQLDMLVNFLVGTGWEPLAESGVHWFSRKFRRRVAVYIPDPDPAHPYVVGDSARLTEQVRRLNDRRPARPDPRSLQELGQAWMQLGVALEREHRATDAFTAYGFAVQVFEEMSAHADVARARQWAERVRLRAAPSGASGASPIAPVDSTSSGDLGALRQRMVTLWRADDGSPEQRHAMARASLDYATAVIDAITAGVNEGHAPREQLDALARTAMRELNDLMSIADADEDAEGCYQLARLLEAERSVLGSDALARAKRELGTAIERSSRGTGSRLDFYRTALAAFRERWPDI
jgi:hypothetical protein